MTVPLSALFTIETLGQLTVTVTGAGVVAEPALPVVSDALLETVPQVADVVGDTTSMATLAPGARLAKVHVSTCGLAVEIEHPSGGVGAGVTDLMDQLSPALLGNVSVTVTLVAVPAPMLVTVIVKPIGLPELTLD